MRGLLSPSGPSEGLLVHLHNHDVTYGAVARAPIAEIEDVRKRMGWRFRWLSSHNSNFNYDFNVSFTPEQIAAGRAFYNYEYVNPWLEDRSGDSVFFKDDAGQIFHTYSSSDGAARSSSASTGIST